MRKTITVIIVVLIVLTSFQQTALAENFGLVTGDWALQYIDQFSGNSAGIRVQAKNTSSTKTIYYVTMSLSSLSGDVIFTQTDPMLDLHSGLSVTLDYTAYIADEYKGESLIMQVTMSYTTPDAVDGTGTTSVIYGEAATPTPTFTPTPTPTNTHTPTPAPTHTPTPEPTATPTAEATPTPTPIELTPTPTLEVTPEVSEAPESTAVVNEDENQDEQDENQNAVPAWLFVVIGILILVVIGLLVVIVIFLKKGNSKTEGSDDE